MQVFPTFHIFQKLLDCFLWINPFGGNIENIKWSIFQKILKFWKNCFYFRIYSVPWCKITTISSRNPTFDFSQNMTKNPLTEIHQVSKVMGDSSLTQNHWRFRRNSPFQDMLNTQMPRNIISAISRCRF